MKEETKDKVMTATRFEIEQQLNGAIGSIKANGLPADIKVKLVKLKVAMSKIVADIQEFRKTTIDSVEKPEGFEELKSKVESNEATPEELSAFNESSYNKEIADILIPYLNEIVEVDFDGITEEEFWKVVESTDLELVYGYEYLMNKLVK